MRSFPRTAFLLIVDLLAVFNGLLLAVDLRLGTDGMLDQLNNKGGWLKISLASCVWLTSFYLHDLYDFTVISRRQEMAFRAIQAVGVAWAFLAIIYYFMPRLELGPGTGLYAVGITLTVLMATRLIMQHFLDHPDTGEKILIIGDGPEVKETINAALKRRAAGYRIIGFLTESGTGNGNGHGNGHLKLNANGNGNGNGNHNGNGNGHGHLPVRPLGTVCELEQVINAEKIQRVVVALRQRRGVFPAEVLLRLRLKGEVRIDECSSFYEQVSGKVHLDMVRPSWLIFSEYSRNTQIRIAVRDAVHRLLALLGLIISLPVALITAVLIKLDSPGPIFFRQMRGGKKDTTFELIKFRSMKVDAESNGKPVWATENDDRVTRIGRIIRKTRIDEIPQFWNIIKGEMKFVGPRPERPHFIEQLAREIPFYEHRHLVAPGLTGWAQIKYPYGASIEDARQKLEYDLYYIKNQTLLLDLMIVLQTFKIILLGRGGR